MSKAKIKSLSKKIIQARHDYYNDEPTITDAEFDTAIDELIKLDPEHPAITSIGAPVISEWPKYTHVYPCKSLNKAQDESDFKKWTEEVDNHLYLVTLKLDGISVSTDWENGKLIRAVSRGDGAIGEAITENVIRMKGIPKKLNEPFTGNIRGEIVLLKSDHLKHFADKKNPRNAASGTAKRYDGRGSEHLTVMFYSVVAGADLKDEEDQFKYLKKLGLQVPAYWTGDYDDVLNVYNDFISHKRAALDFDIDGLVVRVIDIEKQKALGEKNNRPKGQIAFKFPTDEVETTVKAIVAQVGNSGNITPVAELEPVWLMGATISRATLHNMDYVNDLGVDVGATVKIIRSNDIIPRVTQVIKPTGTVYQGVKNCPECNAKTEFNGKFLICPNTLDCPAQKLGKFLIWINEQNILELSEATVQRFLDAGIVEDIADLYLLKPEQIETLERMGSKIANKLVGEIAKHKELPLQNIIGGLGIKGVATTTTKLVIDAGYDTLDKLYGISAAELEEIPGFGAIRARDLHNGLKKNKPRIDALLAAGVTIKEKKKMAETKLTGQSVCFTGKSSLPRKQLQALAEAAGLENKDSVGKGLTYLVMAEADSTSSKSVKAKKFGTQVLSEAEFMELIK